MKINKILIGYDIIFNKKDKKNDIIPKNSKIFIKKKRLIKNFLK